jgi:hypothetical protein
VQQGWRAIEDITAIENRTGPEGLPREIYCFTTTTEWSVCDDIQSDIFDRLR